ncbi:MAG TPA: SDR family NAD(P)-dependent oxidoreductase [Myxococcales bacterium]
MKLEGKVCVVTGGANGIGRALCVAFAAEGAQVVVSDVADASEVAALAKGTFVECDVSREGDVAALVEQAVSAHGRIDLFASNAGIARGNGADASNDDWQRSWEVNVMAHVFAARHVLPSMLARKQGYLLQTASAAGLLTSLGAAPYAATKHAAVAFAEWLSITHHHQGLRVSCLCPQGVQTCMLAQAVAFPAGQAILAAGAVLTPEQVAKAAVDGIGEERFHILPHPEVSLYMQRRAQDHERWLSSMRALQQKVSPGI